MKILITGPSRGIGRAAALRFLEEGHEVVGIDVLEPSIDHPRYTHFQADVRDAGALPALEGVGVIFANAGRQNSGDDIGHDLVGAINVVEKYMHDPALRSVLFNASASAVSGQEFPEYAAAKAGLLGYMKNTAIRLAPRQVTVNALCLGGVATASNAPVMDDPALWERIMDVTPMKKWMSEDEVCDWIEFLTLTNRSMSGQSLLIDNGEYDLRATFVWPEG